MKDSIIVRGALYSLMSLVFIGVLAGIFIVAAAVAVLLIGPIILFSLAGYTVIVKILTTIVLLILTFVVLLSFPSAGTAY